MSTDNIGEDGVRFPDVPTVEPVEAEKTSESTSADESCEDAVCFPEVYTIEPVRIQGEDYHSCAHCGLQLKVFFYPENGREFCETCHAELFPRYCDVRRSGS